MKANLPYYLIEYEGVPTMIHTINYAYPSSVTATKLSRGKAGCAYIADVHGKILNVFDTLAKALSYADENNIVLDDSSRHWAVRVINKDCSQPQPQRRAGG
jgi:hypothetical protein